MAEKSFLKFEVRGGGREEIPHLQGEAAAQAQEGQEELLHVQGQEGRPRPSGCALLEQLLRATHVQGKRNPSKKVGVARGHQREDTETIITEN